MGPDKKKALEAATQVLTGIGVGFSVDRSLAVDLKGMPPLLPSQWYFSRGIPAESSFSKLVTRTLWPKHASRNREQTVKVCKPPSVDWGVVKSPMNSIGV